MRVRVCVCVVQLYGVFYATSFLDLFRRPRQVSTSSLGLTVTVQSDEQYLFLVGHSDSSLFITLTWKVKSTSSRFTRVAPTRRRHHRDSSPGASRLSVPGSSLRLRRGEDDPQRAPPPPEPPPRPGGRDDGHAQVAAALRRAQRPAGTYAAAAASDFHTTIKNNQPEY